MASFHGVLRISCGDIPPSKPVIVPVVRWHRLISVGGCHNPGRNPALSLPIDMTRGQQRGYCKRKAP
jgi:hypothetical protein